MAFRILGELALATVSFFAGGTLWQLHKRKAFLKGASASQPFLDRLISQKTLANPPSQIEPYLAKGDVKLLV
jgi:hypothetical protein